MALEIHIILYSISNKLIYFRRLVARRLTAADFVMIKKKITFCRYRNLKSIEYLNAIFLGT